MSQCAFWRFRGFAGRGGGAFDRHSFVFARQYAARGAKNEGCRFGKALSSSPVAGYSRRLRVSSPGYGSL
eukprot:2729443-Lingulodinium_polyedra.AAC.1